jgi:hypothetical protein
MTEIDVVKPAIKNRITPVNGLPTDRFLPIPGATLIVPSVDLSWTGSPTFEVGYRMPDSLGYFALDYRFLVSEGTGSKVVGSPGTVFADRTRLNLNEATFDYGTNPYEFAPHWDFAWRIGIRFDDLFFDSRITSGPAFEQGSNLFWGAGPHARLDLMRRFDFLPGLAVFGRLDGAVLEGQIHQHFRANDPGGIPFEDVVLSRSQLVPSLNVQVGLTYTPPVLRNLHLTTGYTYEHFWYVGQLGVNPDGSQPNSRGEIYSQGLFLRAQFDY